MKTTRIFSNRRQKKNKKKIFLNNMIQNKNIIQCKVEKDKLIIQAAKNKIILAQLSK